MGGWGVRGLAAVGVSDGAGMRDFDLLAEVCGRGCVSWLRAGLPLGVLIWRPASD